MSTSTRSSSRSPSMGGGLFRFGLGPAILFGAAWLIFWNEGGAAKTQASLAEGASSVVSVSATNVDPAHEGKLVHIVGQMSTKETLTDPELQVSLTAIKLQRVVEMYQWQEAEIRQEGPSADGKPGAPVSTFEHSKEWKSDWLNSALFKQPMGHGNPSAMLFSGEKWQAEKVHVGAFELTASQTASLSPDQQVSLSGNLGKVQLSPPALGKLYRDDKQLLIRPDLAAVDKNGDRLTFKPAEAVPPPPPDDVAKSPNVGDVRIRFLAMLPREVTLLGKQVGNQLQPYRTKAGVELKSFRLGAYSAEKIFATAQTWSNRGTWFFRGLALLVVYVGLAFSTGSLVRWLSGRLSANRLLQPWVSRGVFYVRAALTLALTSTLVGAAWFYYRPAWAIGLFVIGGLFLVASVWLVWQLTSRASSESAG